MRYLAPNSDQITVSAIAAFLSRDVVYREAPLRLNLVQLADKGDVRRNTAFLTWAIRFHTAGGQRGLYGGRTPAEADCPSLDFLPANAARVRSGSPVSAAYCAVAPDSALRSRRPSRQWWDGTRQTLRNERRGGR
jgi:hypothetical protein